MVTLDKLLNYLGTLNCNKRDERVVEGLCTMCILT